MTIDPIENGESGSSVRGKINAAIDGVNNAFATPYIARGVDFDGQTFIRRAVSLAGAVDGPKGIVSYWAKNLFLNAVGGPSGGVNTFSGDDGNYFTLGGTAADVDHAQAKTGAYLTNSDYSMTFDFDTDDYVFFNDVGYHVLMSWDVGFAPGSRRLAIYVNDDPVAYTVNIDTGDESFLIKYGDIPVDFGSGFPFWLASLGSAADFYVNFVDTIVESDNTISLENRRKFITAEGTPADPTGWPANAVIGCTGDKDSFAANSLGSGGPLTAMTMLTCDAASGAGPGPITCPGAVVGQTVYYVRSQFVSNATSQFEATISVNGQIQQLGSTDYTGAVMKVTVNGELQNSSWTPSASILSSGDLLAGFSADGTPKVFQANVPPYVAPSVFFDGNTILHRLLLDCVDSENVTYSVNLRVPQYPLRTGAAYFCSDPNDEANNVWNYPNGQERLNIELGALPFTDSIEVHTADHSAPYGEWHHVLFSANTSTVPATWKIYIDDVDATNGGSTNDAPYIPGFAAETWFGSDDDTPGHAFRGEISDFQLYVGTNLQVGGAIPEASRRLFIDADGKPVNPAVAVAALGTPTILFSGDYTTFGDNQGSGGAFSVLSGALLPGLTSPSATALAPGASLLGFDSEGNEAVFSASDFLPTTTVRVRLTSDDIAALNATPIELIPAPGAGFMIWGHSCLVKSYADHVCFSGNPDCGLRYDGDSTRIGSGLDGFIKAAASSFKYFILDPDTSPLTIAEDKALIISAPDEPFVVVGQPTVIVLNSGGAGYAVDDLVHVVGGDNALILFIDTVDISGSVLTFHIYTPGFGYSVSTNVATVADTGVGTGFTVDITTVTDPTTVIEVTVVYSIEQTQLIF